MQQASYNKDPKSSSSSSAPEQLQVVKINIVEFRKLLKAALMKLDPQCKLLRSSQQSSGRSESLRKKKCGEVENCNEASGFYASPNGGGPVSVGERTVIVDSNSTGIIVRLDVSWMFSFHKVVYWHSHIERFHVWSFSFYFVNYFFIYSCLLLISK